MRAVIDTNVIFSALHRPDSAPGRLLLLALEGGVDLFAPDIVRAELKRVLRGKLGYTDVQWEATLQALPVSWVAVGEYEHLMPLALAAIRDPDDAPLLAVALLLKAGVVSGDKAFHPLRKRIVKTWKPRAFLDR